MVFLCLVSGILMLGNKPKSRLLNILGLGMVIYSVLNAAGYYGEKNETLMMIIFLVLFILTSVAIILHPDSKIGTKT
jgi:amino acid permease